MHSQSSVSEGAGAFTSSFEILINPVSRTVQPSVQPLSVAPLHGVLQPKISRPGIASISQRSVAGSQRATNRTATMELKRRMPENKSQLGRPNVNFYQQLGRVRCPET